MAKSKSYEVQAILKLCVTTQVTAASIEEAAEKSKALEVSDFVDIPRGDYQDGNMRISGVYESDYEI